MLLELLMTKTEREQAAYERIVSTCSAVRTLLGELTDYAQTYESLLSHLRSCQTTAPCTNCVDWPNLDSGRAYKALKEEIGEFDYQTRADVAPWLERVSHLEHLGNTIALGLEHITGITQRYHAAVAELEDARVLAETDEAWTDHGPATLRAMHEVLAQQDADANGVRRRFGVSGERHVSSAHTAAQKLTPRLASGEANTPRCDAVVVIIRAAVAERYRRLALDLDSFSEAARKSIIARRAELMDRLFATVTL